LLRRPYDLRHSGVTWRLNSGVPPTEVAAWAGHSVEVLMRTYARCMTGRQTCSDLRRYPAERCSPRRSIAALSRRPGARYWSPEGVRGERQDRSVVQSVRLPAEDYAEIERIAAQAKVPVGALIRGWVLAGLAAERGTSLRDAIEHLAEEAQRLRRLAAVNDVA
jgi:predicted DNA-binding ribbon-helix-helix protein